MKTNILLPLKSNGWHDQNTTTDTLDALATLETVKSTIGSRAYSLIIENCDLAALVYQCREKVRRVRPGRDSDALKGPDRSHSYRRQFDLRPHLGCLPNMERPLKERLEAFRQDKYSVVRACLHHHLNAAHYKQKEVTFLHDFEDPSLTISRTRRQWTDNQWDVRYEIRVPRSWYLGKASTIADAFNNSFFPLICEKAESTGEHQLFKVRRVKIKGVPGKPEYKLNSEDGYAAFIDRRADGKGYLTGWGDSPEGAAKDLAKSRAKEARARLLKV